MASQFLSGQRDVLGSGGKVLRGRSLLPRFSPYSRPSSSSALVPFSAPEAQTGRSPSWLRGLISGAGKLISSVLGSDGGGSSPSECFSDSPSDEYYYSSPSEHDQFLSDGFTKFKMRESDEKRNVGSLAIVPKSETKLIIEQLLLQETFTRDECNKLIEVIQSRVIDIPSAEVVEETQYEVPKRVADKGPWKSLNHNWNFSGIPNYSLSNLSALSPSLYTHGAVSPDIRNKAVMEAKKWFKEKKLSPSSKYDQECGPCILNTDMNQYGFDSDCGSPIEMAKLYMQSLPPWRSPTFSTVGFKTPPPSGNDNSYNIGNHLLPSSEDKKMDYLARHEAELTTRFSVQETSRIPSASAKLGNKEDQDKHLNLHEGAAAELYQTIETENDFSGGIIFQPRQTLKESQEDKKMDYLARHEAELTRLSVQETSRIPSASAKLGNKEDQDKLSDKHLNLHEGAAAEVYQLIETEKDFSGGIIFQPKQTLKESQEDVKMPLPTEEQIGNISALQNSLVLASTTSKDDGNLFPQNETILPEIVTPADPSIQKISGDKVKFRANNCIQVNTDSGFKHTDSISDSKPPVGNPCIQGEEIRSAEAFNTNGHFTEVNMNSDLESLSRGDPTATNSSNGAGVAVASITERIHEPPSDVFSDIPCTLGASSNTSKPQNGAKMKSIERMLTESPEPSRGKRKAKKVARQKKPKSPEPSRGKLKAKKVGRPKKWKG